MIMSSPLLNTIIVFVILMALLYYIKPDVIYDHKKKEFRQFGIDNDKTLLPIYFVGIILAILLYILFSKYHEYEKNNKNDVKMYESHKNRKTRKDNNFEILKNQMSIMNRTLAKIDNNRNNHKYYDSLTQNSDRDMIYGSNTDMTTNTTNTTNTDRTNMSTDTNRTNESFNSDYFVNSILNSINDLDNVTHSIISP